MKRMLRVNELIKREVGTIVERLISPDLDCLVTITEVQTSPDLRNASVGVSIYGNSDKKEEAMQLFRNRRVDVQRELGKNIRLKYIPVLRFRMDDKWEKADKIYQILDGLEIDENESSDQ